MGQLMGLMDWQKMAHLMFFYFFFSFLLFFTLYYSYIFLFLHITKASLRLTLYRLKGKKGVRRLESPYRLKNYD
jgi:hypothetical protein